MIKNTLVIIPTYNEVDNILELIESITTIDNKLHILFVDDNSPDGTGQLIAKASTVNTNIHLISRKEKLGLGTAYIAGFKWAINNNYDYLIQMDADLSHDPMDIPRLLNKSKKYDLVIGSRYLKGFNVVNWPLRRLLLSYFANLYARILTGLPLNDSTGGFKCFNIAVLKNIDLEKISSQGYSFQIEMNYLAWVNGANIKEISITFTDRTVGLSKMSKTIIFEAILTVPRIMLNRIFSI